MELIKVIPNLVQPPLDEFFALSAKELNHICFQILFIFKLLLTI
jgi:hypothetical protein